MTDTHSVYLALGANLGDRKNTLNKAIRALPPPVEITAVSRLYETAPAYVLDQPAFLNMALQGQTELSPSDLLAFLKRLEEKIGRKKTVRYGPRKIDLDIIFYNRRVLNLPDLQIPHPRMQERGFVLHPLTDIAPNYVHPVLNRTITDLAADLPSDDGILTVLE